MSTTSLLRIGQQLKGKLDTYRITKQISDFVYLAVNPREAQVVIKSIDGHWRLANERDVLRRFQDRTRNIRPLLDEILEPATPPAIVLKYLDDDLTRAERKQRLTRQEIKQVARHVLQALEVIHEDGYVHTDIKPSNILVDYGSTGDRFSQVALADFGGTVSAESKYARDAAITGTSLFRAPEVHLEIPWDTSADIWSFGVTLINLIWGLNFHIFKPEEPEGHEMYDAKVLVHQHQIFGPFPESYRDITTDEDRGTLTVIMSAVPPEQMKPFQLIGEREICDADKAFILKIMKLDPRDRPTARKLLQDEWFLERSERTVGWFSRDEWQQRKADE